MTREEYDNALRAVTEKLPDEALGELAGTIDALRKNYDDHPGNLDGYVKRTDIIDALFKPAVVEGDVKEVMTVKDDGETKMYTDEDIARITDDETYKEEK